MAAASTPRSATARLSWRGGSSRRSTRRRCSATPTWRSSELSSAWSSRREAAVAGHLTGASRAVPRYLVLGDPVVSLGANALINDGALIVDGSEIVEVGSRTELEGHGPFTRVLGSADHFVMPGF